MDIRNQVYLNILYVYDGYLSKTMASEMKRTAPLVEWSEEIMEPLDPSILINR